MYFLFSCNQNSVEKFHHRKLHYLYDADKNVISIYNSRKHQSNFLSKTENQEFILTSGQNIYYTHLIVI